MGFYGNGVGGHSSWIFLVIVAAGILIRMLSSSRRGSMGGGRMRTRQGPPPGMSSFQGQSVAPSPVAPPRTGPTYTGIPAGWMADPSAKHEQRYWSGTEWTEHVMNDGTPTTDPLPNRAKPQDEGPSDGPDGTGPPSSDGPTG